MSSKAKVPLISKETTQFGTSPPSRQLTSALLCLTTYGALATWASRILPHIDPHANLLIFLCFTSILLNISAAISTVTLTAMNIKLDFRLSPSIQGSGRIAKLFHVHWIFCTLGGMVCLIAVLVPHWPAIFTWTWYLL